MGGLHIFLHASSVTQRHKCAWSQCTHNHQTQIIVRLLFCIFWLFYLANLYIYHNIDWHRHMDLQKISFFCTLLSQHCAVLVKPCTAWFAHACMHTYMLCRCVFIILVVSGMLVFYVVSVGKCFGSLCTVSSVKGWNDNNNTCLGLPWDRGCHKNWNKQTKKIPRAGVL